ncbi:MAG TPA: rod shape-determining protein MreC [Candidatus Omnitrophica bacterium]|nr:rod shape-determining protein MreC [Candidatus Omnitrophota bacterium]
MFFPKRKLIAFLFLFCVTLLVLFLSSREAAYIFRTATADISKIPLSIANALTHELRAAAFFHRSYWDNLKLINQKDEMEARLLLSQGVSAENDRLRKLLGLMTELPYKTEAARVIGKDFNSFRPYLLLDKGESVGIKKYSAVLTPLGLVGKVLESGRFSSKVILINDPDLSVPALIVRTQEQGLVSGTLDGRSKLRFLDLDSEVMEGDLVVTSGLNMTYPAGILIGKVKFVGVESSGLGKFAILEPAVRVSSVSEVLIVV